MGLLKRSNEIIGMKIHVPVCVLSLVQLFATPWTVTHQALLSMRFFRQEYWSGLPFPPPGDLHNPATESLSLVSPGLAGGYFTTGTTWEVNNNSNGYY